MSYSVLIAEDDLLLLDLMAVAFSEAGFAVFKAHDGEQAIEMAGRFKPDLVVTDVVMPNVEGIAVLLALKKSSCPPKVIVISGAFPIHRRNYLAWALQLGADAVLAKPFRTSELVRLASRILGCAGDLISSSGESDEHIADRGYAGLGAEHAADASCGRPQHRAHRHR